MKWQFGIREKFALVAIALVVSSSFILHRTLFQRTTDIVVEHELVDLQDEGDLRCWEIINAVSRLRSEVGQSAADPARLARLLSVLPKAAYRPPAPDTTRWWEDILSVRSVQLDGSASSTLFEVPDISAPPIPGYLVAAATPSRPDAPARPLVSTILPLDIPVGSLGSADIPQPSPDSTPALERIPVMWGLCRLSDNPGEALAILLPISSGSSPRHLTFILDQDGNFLQHPLPPNNPQDDAPEIYQDLDLFEVSKFLESEDRYSGAELNRQVQRGALFKSQPLHPDVSYFYLEGTATPDLTEEIIKNESDRSDLIKEFDALWSRDIARNLSSLNVRFGRPNSTSSTFRILGQTEASVLQARDFITDAYKGRFPDVQKHVRWRKGIQHSLGDVYIARFYLNLFRSERPGGPEAEDPPYFFVSAVFREELAFSIGTEFERLRTEGLIFAILSGIAAFLAAIFFVRPLRNITKTAQQAVVSDSDSAQLQHKIEIVRHSLPVRRRDEVGAIARSLENLLRQVLNGHERLRQANADLDGKVREKTRELVEANEELRGLAAAKDEFLASVSHELRQPLNSIFGYLQFLEMSDLDDEQKGDVEKTHLAASYLHRLINDILDYQKIIMGGMELEPAEFDAAEFFQNIKDSMIPQAAERGNSLVFEGTSSLGSLFNDRPRLQQILTNLLSNACKFTGNGTVTVSAKRIPQPDGDRISVRVSDTGRGMKPEEKEHLFVKFKKLASKEGNKSGTGLGLVISKGLTELMGGSISCQSTFGKGTTFTLDIPALIPASGDPPPLTQSPAPKRGAHLPPAPSTDDLPLVLVIDDDPTVCSLMGRFLQGHGYSVISATDGESGVALAKSRRPAVITLDVVLPTRDGWEILSDLKSDPDTADIPVIMITFIEEKKRGFTLGADDYLVKPVDWEDFSRRIARVLGRAEPGAPALVVDDDPDTRALFRRTLEKDGLAVIEAENGEVALARVSQSVPSVIILDLMMPVMDGFEFIDQLRKNPLWRNIPVLVVTAKSTGPEDRRRLDGGVGAILNKGGSDQGTLLTDILEMVHRHAPHPKQGKSGGVPGDNPDK